MIYLIISSENIKKYIEEIFPKKKEEKIIEDNKRNSKNIYYDKELGGIIKELKKFRKYNKKEYDNGMKYLEMFMHTKTDLERDIKHPKQYFDNAEIYIQEVLRSFHSITINMPEEKYIDGLKYNKMNKNKLSTEMNHIIKELNIYTHKILYNLSIRFDKEFIKKPDIYKNGIHMNSGNIKENNHYDKFNYY